MNYHDIPAVSQSFGTPLDLALAELPVPDENWQPTAMARGLIRGYAARWNEAQRHIVLHESERTYTTPLYNPLTQRSSRTFTLAGKCDKLAEQDGAVLFDHKTTSHDLSEDSVYWRQLAVDSQPSHYELLLHMNGIKLDRVVWDVVRKPGIRPRALKKTERASLFTLQSYYGSEVSDAARQYGVDEGTENAELYELRVAHETTTNPERYFARRSAKRLNAELSEYAEELWDMAASIRDARAKDRWHKNSGACLLYNSPCVYLGICSGQDTPDSDKWQRVDNVHRELDLVATDGRQLLTHSRLRCFSMCRRKHYYRYELGLRRVEDEETAALSFGHLFHFALDQFWRAHANHQNQPHNTDQDR